MRKKLYITSGRVENMLKLQIEGELNTNTVKKLTKYFGENLDGVDNLEVDCSELVFISSAGLRELLAAAQIMDAKDGNMVIRNLQPNVRKVFDMTGMSDVIAIE